MTKLEQLYAKREVFKEFGEPIPELLLKQIEEEENNNLLNKILSNLGETLPNPIETFGISEDIRVCLQYHNGHIKRIGISRDDIICDCEYEISYDTSTSTPKDYTTSPSEIISSVSEPIETPNNKTKKTKTRGESKPFCVKFEDGTEFCDPVATNTFIKSLQHIGLDKVSTYTGKTFIEYPLVGKEQRITQDGREWQKQVDGWWIYTIIPSSRKIDILQDVAATFGIKIEIYEVDKSVAKQMSSSTSNAGVSTNHEISYVSAPRKKGVRARFSLNGEYPTCKNRSVLRVIEKFMDEFPETSFAELCEMFPKQLQGSYGVVQSIDEIEERSLKNDTEYSRWFMEPEEILTSGDDVRFAVSSEWGASNYPLLQQYISDHFGWELAEV